MANTSLLLAKFTKNDEFYTNLSDIESEILYHKEYLDYLKGKVVYCNCDNPEKSNFYKFFFNNFVRLKLKRVIFTYYNEQESYKYEITSNNIIKTKLLGNGDFRSNECLELVRKSDIVITNPPFSLFRDFIKLVISEEKDLLIIGNEVQCTSKEIFPLFKSNKLHFGHNNISEFSTPDGFIKKFGNIIWYTTIKINNTYKDIKFDCLYNEEDYPKYSNYDAIEVNKINKIPKDYQGIMGVYAPNFFKKCSLDKFEIIGVVNKDTSKGLGVQEIGDEWVENYKANGGTGHITARMRNLVYFKDGKSKMPNSRILIKFK